MTKTKKSLPAILLCGHGSRSTEAATEFQCLTDKVQKKMPAHHVTGGFLEFNQPTIKDALQKIYDQGIKEIIVQPVTLYNAGHTKKDIPEILALFQKNHPDVQLHYGLSLGLGPSVIKTAVNAVESVMPDGDREDFKLLVVGRGAKDRAISDQTIKLCQKLHENLAFGDSRYCYSFENTPLLNSALEQAALSHYHHVVILPFLLFSGRLLSDIRAEVDIAAQKYPAFTFHKAPHLGPHDFIADAVFDRIKDAMPQCF